MNNPRIYLSPPHMGGMELKYIQEAFDQNWIAPLGPNVDGFERELSGYMGIKAVAALSSGTAALHLALQLIGVKRDDEVLCSAFTFVASANPITYLGAKPVFVESEEETWNISPVFLEEAIQDRVAKGSKPKALVLVHLYGQPAQMDEILAITDRYEIPVVEDAAESLGSTYKDRKTGTFGKIGILSFNGNKIITTSGGGALVSNDVSLVEKARFLATQARDPAPHYEHSELGYNYRMSNIIAGIGRGQLEMLDEWISKRRLNFEYYKNVFKGIGAIKFLEEAKNTFTNRWLSCITIDPASRVKPEDIRLALEKENIESRPLWKPMQIQPLYRHAPYYGDRLSERLFEQGLCLPSGTSLSEEDLQRICSIVNNSFT